ncbi:MAG TPA: tetratricopeptide repeat protein [bacterium]|nr:tetratricopeptide repeat protein [bacterium]
MDLGNDNDLILGIIPINARNSRTLMEWREIHHYFRALSFAVNQISEKDTYEKASQLFDSEPASLKRDRFIESCFWERRAEFYYQFDFKSHYSDLLFALRQAIEKGYPSAHLYYKLGSLYLQKKNFTEAQKSLCAALRIEPGYSEALQALRLVEDRIKETKN